MKPEPNPDILDYIRANRGTYTREAIERELRDAGHSQEAIDAAWRALPVEGTAAPLPARSALATVQFWLLLFVVACVALTVFPLISLFILNAVLSATSGSVDRTWLDSGLVAILIALGPFLLGYLAIGFGGWWLRRRDQAAAYGVLSGLVVAFVLSVIVAGACAALIAQL
jgi:hypothetical protein